MTGDELIDFVNNELFPVAEDNWPPRPAIGRAARWSARCSKMPTTT